MGEVADANRGIGEASAVSADLFRLAMEKSAIGMCLVAPEGAFLSVNPALCSMLGRDEAALSAASWQDLTHPDDLEVDLGLVADVVAAAAGRK